MQRSGGSGGNDASIVIVPIIPREGSIFGEVNKFVLIPMDVFVKSFVDFNFMYIWPRQLNFYKLYLQIYFLFFFYIHRTNA